MKIKTVCGDRCIIRPVKTPTRVGKIYLPISSVRNTSVGKVLHVGPECKSSWLQPGVMVIMDEHKGVMLDKEENLLLVAEEDIISIVEDYEGAAS